MALNQVITISFVGAILATAAQAQQIQEVMQAYFERNVEKETILANAGNSEAQNLLSQMYRDGSGTPKNEKLEILWLKRAAMGRNPSAELKLAYKYKNGNGFPLNFSKAARWFELAARAKVAPAAEELGDLYRDGKLGAVDRGRALRWYGVGADRAGGNSARERFAEVCVSQHCDLADRISAVKFMIINIDRNTSRTKAAGLTQRLKADLSPAQLGLAEQSAETWEANHPEPAIPL